MNIIKGIKNNLIAIFDEIINYLNNNLTTNLPPQYTDDYLHMQ